MPSIDDRAVIPSGPAADDKVQDISILIVDDDESVRISLQQLLGEHYDLTEVDNGLKAIAMIAEREFDLVILDLKMPGPDGLEVLREIKKLRPHTGVLIYSAFGHKENMKTAIKYGVDGFLEKPMDSIHVLSTISQLVSQRRKRVAVRSLLQEVERLYLQREPVDGRDGSSETRDERLDWLRKIISYDSMESADGGSELDIQLKFAQSLSFAIESKDSYTHKHSENVARHCNLVGRALSYSSKRLMELLIGTFFHDVGKLAVRSEILESKNPLSHHEMNEIRRHTNSGERLVSSINVSGIVKQIIRNHHERFDGSGYPDRLRGEFIPEEVRIVTVADAYDAMVSYRPYRPVMTREEARQELLRHKGTQFDPRITDIFLEVVH